MDAAQQLERVANEVRTYSCESYNTDHLEEIVRKYTQCYGGNWGHGIKVLKFVTATEPEVYQTSHLIKFGEEGLEKVEAHFGVTLPESAHRFYRRVFECVLSLSRVIVVLSPEGIIAHEEWHRATYKDAGLDLPVTIIRFATLMGDPLDFAFRKSVTDGKWRIDLIASADDSPEECHSVEADGLETDEDIDAWMERMLRTDAFPLAPGFEDWERRGAIRLP